MHEAMTKCFNDNDFSSKGYLSLSEFVLFYNDLMDQGAKRGNYEDDRPETPIRTFNALNQINS